MFNKKNLPKLEESFEQKDNDYWRKKYEDLQNDHMDVLVRNERLHNLLGSMAIEPDTEFKYRNNIDPDIENLLNNGFRISNIKIHDDMVVLIRNNYGK